MSSVFISPDNSKSEKAKSDLSSRNRCIVPVADNDGGNGRRWLGARWSAIRHSGAFLLVPNAAFLLARSLLFGVPRGWINVDYVLAGLIALIAPPWVGVSALIGFCMLEVLVTSSALFYFTWPDWYLVAHYAFQLPMARVLAQIALVFVAGAVVCTCVWKLKGSVTKGKRREAAAVLLAMMLLLSFTRLPGAVTGVKHSDAYTGDRFAFSGMARLLNAMRASSDANAPVKPVGSSAVTVSDIMANAMAHHRNVVLILVESYGRSQDAAVARETMAPLMTPAVMARYEVTNGTVPFKGPTVSAELRELCGIAGGVGTTLGASRFADQCMPKILKAGGYTATAYHGFYSNMFARNRWYRELAFDRLVFLDNLGPVRTCGSLFRGACDLEMAKMVEADLVKATSPQFSYWLTLSSHQPIEVSSETTTELGCGGISDSAKTTECVWAKLIRKANESIAHIATAKGLAPTEFVIVGDHAPPFITKQLRNEFSQNEVPYVHLVPKDSLQKN